MIDLDDQGRVVLYDTMETTKRAESENVLSLFEPDISSRPWVKVKSCRRETGTLHAKFTEVVNEDDTKAIYNLTTYTHPGPRHLA